MDKNDPQPTRGFDPPEEAVWHRMIAEAAYYRAQKPAFAEESELEHWLAAEEEIRLFLAGVSTGAVSMPAPPKRHTETEHAQPVAAPVVAPVVEGGMTKFDAIERRARKPGREVRKKSGANTSAQK